MPTSPRRAEGLGDGAVRRCSAAGPTRARALRGRLARGAAALGVAQLLVHGTATTSCRRHRAGLRRGGSSRGRRVELVELDAADHFDVIEAADPAWAAVVDWLRDRLARSGDLEGRVPPRGDLEPPQEHEAGDRVDRADERLGSEQAGHVDDRRAGHDLAGSLDPVRDRQPLETRLQPVGEQVERDVDAREEQQE